MNDEAVQFFKKKYRAMGPNELTFEVNRKAELSDEAWSALDSVLSEMGLSAAILEKFDASSSEQASPPARTVPRTTGGKVKQATWRLIKMLLWGALGALPGVVLSSINSGLHWYTLLLYLSGALGVSIYAAPIGVIALIAGRNRNDGGSRIANFISLLLGLLYSGIAYHYS